MRWSSPSGFTLVEAIIATALMVTIVAGVAHVVLLAAEQSMANRRELSAFVLAQSKLEELRTAAGVPVSGDDSHAIGVRRWQVERVNAADPTALLLRVCIDDLRVCVAGIRVIPP